MSALFRRTLCAASVVWLLAPSAPASAQSKAAVGVDPAVLQAMGRDLGLNQQQTVDRMTAEKLALERHPKLQQALGPSYAGAWFDPTDLKLVVATTDAKMSKIA